MSFLLILVGFMEKVTKSANMGNFRVLRRGVGIPRSSVGPLQGVACPRHGMAEREVWTTSGTPLRRSTPRRSYYSLHWKFSCFVLFCYFVIPRT